MSVDLLATLPTDTGDAPLAWFSLFLLAAVVGGFAAAWILGLIIRRIARRWDIAVEATRRARVPFRLLFALIAARQLIAATTALAGWQDTILTITGLAVLAVCGWLLAVVAFVAQDLTLARFPVDVVDNRKARRVQTQVILLRRVVVAVIVVLVLATMLLTLPGARQAGATILASAGVLGIVAGLAAQSSLSNLFAGLQLAFTDAIRVDDVVVVEKEWGRIEEITLTYVVVKVWDDRRLILPSTYFTSTPFQNWTRKESAVLGAVEMDVDWRVPVDELRVHLDRTLQASQIWDGRTGVLQVTDAVGSFVRLRILVSAKDGPTVWDLRCEVREALVEFIQRNHPEALPRLRTQVVTAEDQAQTNGSAEPMGRFEKTASDPSSRRRGTGESESTQTMGLFTGSRQAEERAKEFSRP
ncbi:mechanosensitive ion channel [Nakamurella flava]|uniref:Mechanosensitive ion channel n=1 Tax=Nakamurella flava TaxID=2576308 RepID=A0A4V6CRG2_9ACTN|nr:mechanosensitive ion channel domain-containing protein [Nakamurella flava]TKV57375.1 mechanosensitive ion channel [Nakamurella flava]